MTTAKLTLKERLNAFRAEATTLDWSPNGVLSFGAGKSTLYISLTQMKANLSPLFAKHGLEFSANMARPEPMGSASAPSGWIVRLDVTISDVYSDESMDYTFYGYGSGDKGLVIANSFALKTMLSTVFLIADGIEPIDDESTGGEKAVYIPKTPKETAASIDKVKAAAKASEARAAAKPAPKPEPKADAAPEPPAETGNAPSAAPAGIPEGLDISENRRASVVKLLYDISAKHEAGEVSEEEWNQVQESAQEVKDNSSANKFIIRYRKLVR